MRLITWRLICGISSLFSITASCFTALLRPSPRFILVRQKYEETIDILKHMYALNTSRHAEGYAVSTTNIVYDVPRILIKLVWLIESCLLASDGVKKTEACFCCNAAIYTPRPDPRGGTGALARFRVGQCLLSVLLLGFARSINSARIRSAFQCQM